MSMKRMHKLSNGLMGNQVNQMLIIGCIEVCQVKVRRLFCFKVHYRRARAVLENFTEGYSGTIVCDGYSAYNKIEGVTFANCWAYVRRYWLKADSKNGQIGVNYCDHLYLLERQFKHLSPSKQRKKRQKYSKPIVEKFLDWVEKSPFYRKNALAKAAEYTLNRVDGLKAFLKDGRINIDNNPAENSIRPNVIGRKNWLFSVSEAGAKANAICLSIVETTKANGVDFYRYLLKLLNGFTESRYLSTPRSVESIYALVKNDPSLMWHIK